MHSWFELSACWVLPHEVVLTSLGVCDVRIPGHGLFGPTDHQAGRTAIKTMMMTSAVELFTRWHMNTVPLVEQ